MKFADAVSKKEKENPAFKKARQEESALRAQVSALRMQLRKLREEKGLDQGEMGKLIGISQSAVSHFERGTGDVGLFALLRYAQALGQDLRFSVSAAEEAKRESAPAMKVPARTKGEGPKRAKGGKLSLFERRRRRVRAALEAKSKKTKRVSIVNGPTAEKAEPHSGLSRALAEFHLRAAKPATMTEGPIEAEATAQYSSKGLPGFSDDASSTSRS